MKKRNEQVKLSGAGYAITVYRQIPGADIEEGWYYVTHGPWWAPGPDTWHGPYGDKRTAVRRARKELRLCGLRGNRNL